MFSSLNSSRLTFLGNLRHLRCSSESLSDRSKPLKSTPNSVQSFFPHHTDAGLHHLLSGITDIPNRVTNGVGPPMTPHHFLLEFHLSLLRSLRGLFKLVQRQITLQTKGTPRLLKVMCLEHPDDALIHRLQQRRGVRQQEDELDVAMQVLQHVGVGGSVIQDHQDTEGEALRRAIYSFNSCTKAVLLYTWKMCPVIQPLELAYQWTSMLVFS